MRKFFVLLAPFALYACGGAVDPGGVGTTRSADQLSGGEGDPNPPSVPAALTVPEDGDVVLLHAYGAGFQIYACQATATGYGWVFQAPQAELFRNDQLEDQIGIHFKGPTWQVGTGDDVSTVVGGVLAKVSMDPTAVPWLLLKAVSTSGDGVLTGVHYIQRLDTVGGIAPSSGCDASTVGAVANVPYTATYYFYGPPEHGEE